MPVLVAPMEALPASLHDSEQQGDTDEDEADQKGLTDAADEADAEQQQLQEQHHEDTDEALGQRQQRLQKTAQQGQDDTKIRGVSDVQLLAFSDEREQGPAGIRTAAAAARKARDIARGRRAASPVTAAAAASEVGRGLWHHVLQGYLPVAEKGCRKHSSRLVLKTRTGCLLWLLSHSVSVLCCPVIPCRLPGHRPAAAAAAAVPLTTPCSAAAAALQNIT
jgi:hypothetical protein